MLSYRYMHCIHTVHLEKCIVMCEIYAPGFNVSRPTYITVGFVFAH